MPLFTSVKEISVGHVNHLAVKNSSNVPIANQFLRANEQIPAKSSCVHMSSAKIKNVYREDYYSNHIMLWYFV